MFTFIILKIFIITYGWFKGTTGCFSLTFSMKIIVEYKASRLVKVSKVTITGFDFVYFYQTSLTLFVPIRLCGSYEFYLYPSLFRRKNFTGPCSLHRSELRINKVFFSKEKAYRKEIIFWPFSHLNLSFRIRLLGYVTSG